MKLKQLAFAALIAASAAQAAPYDGVPAHGAAEAAVFLADPELGVVGGLRRGDDVVYFEARATAEGEIGTRFLDAHGVTIAIGGYGMDAAWAKDEPFDVATAARSGALVADLASELARLLPDAAFDGERASVAALAGQVQAAGETHEVLRVPALTHVDGKLSDARNAQYVRNAADLMLYRDAKGSLTGSFRGVVLQAFERRVRDESAETADGMRSEVDARIATAQGRALVTQFGGDHIPDGWDVASSAKSDVDPFYAMSELGAAVAAAQTVARSNDASPEAEAIARIGLSLRDHLLPQPTSTLKGDAKALLQPAAALKKRTDIQIWKKPLAGFLAEHSGTKVLHYYDWVTTESLHDVVLFCNHGQCPEAGSMRKKCGWWGPRLNGWRNPPNRSGSGRHSCNTGYGLDSFFRHNCHDDSWTQLKWIKGEGSEASPDHNRCNNAAVYKSAPNCSD